MHFENYVIFMELQKNAFIKNGNLWVIKFHWSRYILIKICRPFIIAKLMFVYLSNSSNLIRRGECCQAFDKIF